MIHIIQKSTKEQKPNPYLEHLEDGAVIFHGLEDTIVGVTHQGFPVYDYSLVIQEFMQQGMQEDEAIEWMEYNVLPIQGGEGFVIYYY